MLNKPQIDRMLKKLERYEHTLYDRIFIKKDHIDFSLFETSDWLTEPPSEGYAAIAAGESWGGKEHYGWFKGCYTVPQELAGAPIYLMPDIGCYEGMLYVDGRIYGNIANKHQVQYTAHGNHYCDLIDLAPEAGKRYDLILELYCGHDYPGCQPFEKAPLTDFSYRYNGADICVKDLLVQEICFDLSAVRQLATEVLPEQDFRRGEVIDALYQVHALVYYDPEHANEAEFRASLEAIRPILKKVLSSRSSSSAPFAGLTGHSHMDTAWLWHMDETVKKCARTYGNALALMDEYPEYRFIQSSSLHSEFLRVHYPELFSRIQQKVKTGQYEPNGGVWIECDCNITGGESMVRQFLWGQRFTRKYFDGYTADSFWLPDTFGYSAAIPQIMRSCGCKYFFTTKLSWNDTNPFPYDTFFWEGLDGTQVLAHFNTTHHEPSVEDLARVFREIKQPSVTNMRYAAYGYGDGGGGPTFEMLEQARRVGDLEGLGKSKHMSASEFMGLMEQSARHLNTYRGELYLELHRGTLTNQHTIKRNNRKSEQRLHDLELLTVMDALQKNIPADGSAIAPLWATLLKNQFHDVLPGTRIHRAHVESRAQTGKLIADADEMIRRLTSGEGDCVSLINTIPFSRYEPLVLDGIPSCKYLKYDCAQQSYIDPAGNRKLLVSGFTMLDFNSLCFDLTEDEPEQTSSFQRDGDTLTTPNAVVHLNEKGGFESYIDLNTGRELREGEYALNTFLMAEDVSESWDNWDMDADIQCKFRDSAELLSSEVISDGAVAYIIRNRYKLSDKSSLTQDVIFFADSPEVRFDTYMDWNDDHRFLKACFDTSIREDFARQEIQFGYVKRPTTRNDSVEQAKFETVNHKYTDLSETRSGVAILNDSKYGITVDGGRLALSLHKGGTRPDIEGDKDGIHHTEYSFYPHEFEFSADYVIRPAYALNYPVRVANGRFRSVRAAMTTDNNTIVETVKPCEDAQRAYIVRMYEAEGSWTRTEFRVPAMATGAFITNMLEEEQQPLTLKYDEKYDDRFTELTFRPFEIKTVKITY